MSLNQSMNISLGSMKNNQYALTVVSHNIANVNTPGYHRQGVNFAESRTQVNGNDVISTIKSMNGATISSLTDYIDEGAFNNLLDSNSNAEYYNTLADALGELEGISDDLGDNGLNALLNDFYKAAANLEQFPTDMAIRQQYVLAAQNVCDKFNQISAKCDSIQDDKFNSISTNVEHINSLLENLAQANQEHVKNGQTTATKAQINSILNELSSYMDITSETNQNGSVNVYIGDTAVVQGGVHKFTLSADFDATNPDNAVNFTLQSTEDPDHVTNSVNSAFESGSMKGYLEFLNGSNKNFTNVNDMKNMLNQAANAFAQALNEIQTFEKGTVIAASITTGDNGDLELEKLDPPVPMFTTKDNTGIFSAGNIQVNTEIIDDPFKVAAARIDTDKDPNWQKAVGNSDNATAITATQNAKICSYNGGKNNCTLSQFLTSNAAKNGMDIANIQAKADTANDIADMDATNYSNLVGVNLDEELADMIKYQRSYEASARLFSTINQLMETIIAMV